MAEEKRLAAHEVAIKLLEEEPWAHITTLAQMYAAGTFVPLQAIPGLIKAFTAAQKKMGGRGVFVEKAIAVLKEQIKEERKEG